MGLLSAFRNAVGDTPASVWECRNCGQTLSADTDECPSCGAEDVVRYDF
jgi:rubrerythrin